MTGENETPDLRRILIALDAGEESAAALEAAARLAAELRAELVGLFVEDRELIEAAALPVVHMIRSHDRAEEVVDVSAMQRGLRVWARRAEHSLTTVAGRWQVKSSFRVTRGAITDEVLTEARTCDLLALGTAGTAYRRRIGATARLAFQQAPCSVMLLKSMGRPGQPVFVLYEGADRLLAIGRRLARIFDAPLRVLAVGRDSAAAAAAEASASAWLAAHDQAADIERLEGEVADAVYESLSRRPGRVLVLDRHGANAQGIEVDRVFQGLAAAIFILG